MELCDFKFLYCFGFLLVLIFGSVNSFECEDDIYRNCRQRARNGECEVSLGKKIVFILFSGRKQKKKEFIFAFNIL